MTGPDPTQWEFADPRLLPDGEDFAGVGADLEPITVLAAYRSGYFPMPIQITRRRSGIGWFSPDPRGVLPIEDLRVSRSLRRSVRRYSVSVDSAFDRVIGECADPRRESGWIDETITTAYEDLHRLGHAHSIEVWEDERLVGGLYGVSIGGLFAGESMFHLATDASKVALVHLVEILGDRPGRLLDVQWKTDHLASLGVIELPRDEYLQRLERALALPPPHGFSNQDE